MKLENNPILAKLMVEAEDRKYQIWERNSMSTNLYSEHFFHQKIDYVHKNPVSGKWNLCEVSEDYAFSSASFYATGVS